MSRPVRGRLARGAAALLTGTALTVAVGVSAPVPASAASTGCTASFSRYDTIRQGSTGAQAKAMECLLRDAGRSTSVNGRFSARDADQLATYRRSMGFRALKTAGRRPWAALLSRGSIPALERGDKGSDVRRLQRSLQALGWTKIDINGRFDARTVSVVKSAQKQRDLKQTGETTKTLWRAIQRGQLAGPPAPKSSRGAKALAFAKKQLGDSYRYGATGPDSWDCSGLTSGAWKAAGVKIPRTSSTQFRSGKKVSRSNLRKGDLVFFYSGPSHVGIYAGNGKIIHSSRPGRPVSYSKISYMPYTGARRPG